MTTTRDRAYPLPKPHVGRWDASSEIAKDVHFPWLAAGADPGHTEAERSRRSTLMPSRVAHLFIALRGDDQFRETTDHYLEEARKEAHPLAAFFIDVLHVLITEKYTINTDGPWPEAARYLLRRRGRRGRHTHLMSHCPDYPNEMRTGDPACRVIFHQAVEGLAVLVVAPPQTK
jgi:hypothetical protein